MKTIYLQKNVSRELKDSLWLIAMGAGTGLMFGLAFAYFLFCT